MEYFLSDSDWVYAWDGEQVFLVTRNGNKPIDRNLDPMWSGCSERDAKYYAERMPF